MLLTVSLNSSRFLICNFRLIQNLFVAATYIMNCKMKQKRSGYAHYWNLQGETNNDKDSQQHFKRN
jgi:hypothetical protein